MITRGGRMGQPWILIHETNLLDDIVVSRVKQETIKATETNKAAPLKSFKREE
jgi:hypothetical protein